MKNALDYGHLPLPILLRIKKGILYVPSSYTITEGVAVGIRDTLKHLEFIGRDELIKAIFDKNNMNDRVFSYVLNGLRQRSELIAVHSVNNEIGELAAQEICDMMK